jgi:hypothetical protein
MENIYKPHRYLFVLGKAVPRVTIGLSILCWLPTLFINVVLFQQMYMPLVRLSLVVNLIVLFIALLFSMVLHEVCGTTYTVSDTAIIKKSPYKTALIHFENVRHFLYFRLPWIKGFGSIKVPGGSIRLPFTIEHLSGCIEDVRQRLETSGRAEAYSPADIEEFKFRAVINETSVKRMERTIPTLFQIAIAGLAESILIAQVFWLMPLKWVLSWTAFGAVLPVIGFLIAETVLNHITIRIAKRDRASLVSTSRAHFFPRVDESKIYWAVGALMTVIYLIAGILFKHFVFEM